MKKQLVSLFAMACMVFASSCTSEEIISQSTGNEVAVTFTANLRNDVKSRAVGDDTDNVDQLVFVVYDKNGKELPELRQSTHVTDDNAKKAITLTDNGVMKEAKIEVVLVKGQTYSFAFWAQKKGHAAYSFNPETAKVEISYQNTNDKAADAFFASVTNHKVTGTFEKNVTLKRPFAQINFLTTAEDLRNAAKSEFTPSQSQIVVKNAATELNVLDGTVAGDTDVTFGLAGLVGHDLDNANADERAKIKNGGQYVGFTNTGTFPLVGTEDKAEPFIYLATAYFLPTVPTASTEIDASVLVKATGKDDYELAVTKVNAQRNYRTNIYGNLLTSNGTFYVTVDPGFVDDYSYEEKDETTKVVGTIEEANALFAEGETNVTITEAPSADATVNLPNTTDPVTINFAFEEPTASSTTITVGYKSGASEKPAHVDINGNENVIGSLVIDVPESTATVNVGEYTNVTATTKANTLYVPKGVKIGTLTLKQGNAEIYYDAVTNLVKAEGYTDKITYLVDNGENFASAMSEGDIVKLMNDIELEAGQKVTIKKGAIKELYLEGSSITGKDNNSSGNFYLINNTGTFTINGEGKIILAAETNRAYNSSSVVVANNPGGNLTVEEGVVIEHLGGTDMAYGIDNLTNGKGTYAVTTIDGATIKSTYRAVRQFLNGVEATNELYVKSGIIEGANKSIWMQDPSKNANTGKLVVESAAQLKGDVYLFVTAGSTEWPVEVSIVKAALVGESKVLTGNVPEGYELVEAGGIYTVKKIVSVENTTSLQEALKEGESVKFTSDIAIAKDDAGSNSYGATGINVLNGQTIDGDGKEISVDAWTTWDSAISTTGGIIKNLKVTGGMRGIFINHNSEYSEKVILDNVVIDGTIYTISCDQGTDQGLEAYSSTFNGWTSYAATIGDVKFVNCKFGEGQGYAFCRPYAPTVFVGCEFEAGFEVDPRAAVTFENCTLAGEPLTAENLATLVTSNIANATVK